MTQLGFGFNEEFERQRDAHLPTEMEQAIAVHRDQIERHHQAMLAGEYTAAMDMRREARRLAKKLNGGDPAILADENAPGYVLARATAAPEGAVPKWGPGGNLMLGEN